MPGTTHGVERQTAKAHYRTIAVDNVDTDAFSSLTLDAIDISTYDLIVNGVIVTNGTLILNNLEANTLVATAGGDFDTVTVTNNATIGGNTVCNGVIASDNIASPSGPLTVTSNADVGTNASITGAVSVVGMVMLSSHLDGTSAILNVLNANAYANVTGTITGFDIVHAKEEFQGQVARAYVSNEATFPKPITLNTGANINLAAFAQGTPPGSTIIRPDGSIDFATAGLYRITINRLNIRYGPNPDFPLLFPGDSTAEIRLYPVANPADSITLDWSHVGSALPQDTFHLFFTDKTVIIPPVTAGVWGLQIFHSPSSIDNPPPANSLANFNIITSDDLITVAIERLRNYI
jgi:hypothetical protein